MPTFSLDSYFNKEAQFKKVLFGFDGKVLETELNELQDIYIHKLAVLTQKVFGSKPLYEGIYSVSAGKLSISNEYAVIDGEIIFIPAGSLDVVIGDSIYLNKKDIQVKSTDAIKKYGNVSSSEVVPNRLYDDRVGEETTRRIQTTYQLMKTNTGEGTFLKLCDITNNGAGQPTVTKLTFEDSPLFKELQTRINDAEKRAKDASVPRGVITWGMLKGQY